MTAIETGVRTHALPPGAVLPPVRKLAAECGLATATVAAAYRTLRQRGIVDTAGRHGTRVRQRSTLVPKAVRPLPEGIVDLSQGEPDPRLLPDIATALTRVRTAPGGYRDAGASPQLVDLAANRLAADGVAGDITVTGGALDGIERTLTARLRPGDPVAVEDPCWANLRDLIAALGMRAIPVPVDAQGPTAQGLADALRAGARAAILTSRDHNPTGAVITADRAADLRAVIAKHDDVLIIEDDHWAELSDDPLHLVADAAAQWIFLRSVSKPYGPDLRLAIACGDEATVAAVQGRMRIGSGWVSTILQHIVLGLWEDPATAQILDHARKSYRDRRVALREALAEHDVPSLGHTGLNVWVPVDDETAVMTGLRDAGYAVAPGSAYRIDSAPGIRISVSALSLDGVPALAEAVATARQASYRLA